MPPPSVSIIVPMRPDGAERDRNWAYLLARYKRLYPDWEIVCHPGNPTGPWSKGTAVNAAAACATGDVLIVSDADVLVGAQVLPDAVSQLEHAPWVIPHGYVYRLNAHVTAQLIQRDDQVNEAGPVPSSRLARRRHIGPAGGGLVVTRTSDFETVGGIDPHFTDWGGEDISFARALDTLVGEHTRLDAPAWHLHHRPMTRRPGNRASEQNEQLAGRYLDANGDPLAMATLCQERPYQGIAGGGLLVASREVIATIPPDPRFTGWGQSARKTRAGATR
jgi:hypothetical protein